jgi:hypothetical protein
MQNADEIFAIKNPLICCYCGFVQSSQLTEEEENKQLIEKREFDVKCINCNEEFVISE